MDVTGTLVADRYELREQIGSGGAGTVFRARDRVLGRDVAVKRLRLDADEDLRTRLGIEARLCGALSHPGIAKVHDYGEEAVGGGLSPYLVMEYVDGPSLRDVLRDQGPLPAERVMSIVAQVADALAVAHAAGVVHRDVKPANILVRGEGTVVLADFGIARARDVEPLTLTGTLVGTVDYISPEQAAGEGATGRSDLYALGMVAHECLTGVRALRRDSEIATLMAHLQEEAPPLPETVPPAVRGVVRRLTARDPGRRPADAMAAAALARAAIRAPEDATDVLVAARRGRRRWLALAPVAAAVACAAYLASVTTGPTPASVGSEAAGAAASAKPTTTSSTSAAISVRSTRPAPVPTPAAAPLRHAPGHAATHRSPARRHPPAKAVHAAHAPGKGNSKHHGHGGPRHGRG